MSTAFIRLTDHPGIRKKQDLKPECEAKYVPIRIAGGFPCVARIDSIDPHSEEIHFTLGYRRKDGSFRHNRFFDYLAENRDGWNEVQTAIFDAMPYVCDDCRKNGDEKCPRK